MWKNVNTTQCLARTFCYLNKKWPTRKKIIIYLTFLAVACPLPTNAVFLGCNTNATEMLKDSECRFSCKEGFEASNSTVRRCNKNGRWSGLELVCRGMRTANSWYFVNNMVTWEFWLPALLIILNIKLIQDCQYCFMVAAIVHPDGRSKIVAAFICIAAELLISCICALINRCMIEELK